MSTNRHGPWRGSAPAAACLLAASLLAAAQDGPPPPPPDAPDASTIDQPDAGRAQHPPRRPRNHGPRGSGSPVDRWLQFLERNHPEEAQRLRTLRTEDPEAFRREMWQRLEQARSRFGNPPPRPGAPPGSDTPGPRGGRGGWKDRGQDDESEAEMQQLMQQVKSLVAAHAAATDAATRAGIRAQLVAPMTRIIDLREADRARRIARMEQEVQRLKQELEARGAARAQFVRERIDELLRAGGGSPPPPPETL